MLKYAALLIALCCVGCQTTQTTTETVTRQDPSLKSEMLSLRVEKYVTSYDVEVQRAVLTDSETDQWAVISAPRVSGYPDSWRTTESILNPVEPAATASYLLNGEMISISLDPGTHLVAKVLPVRQNTARVIGIFSEAKATENGLEIFSVPFDISCVLGELNVIYREEIDTQAALMNAVQ